MGRERTYRSEWVAVWTKDNSTGRPKIALYHPVKIPVRVTSWRDRFTGFSGFDVLLLGGAVVCFILALATR